MDNLGEPAPCDVVTKRRFKQRTMTELRSLARSFTKGAIDVLVHLMSSKEVNPTARIAAAIAILDRGWGKPMQPIGTENPIEMIHRIERVIVYPEHLLGEAVDQAHDAISRISPPSEIESS